ncbi:MAG TPA: peptidoglycan recognition family protein [Lapillicoccus sp.]|nr:peptidoglycan recognition family protein [Lapillicoccus sp.]
MARSAHPHIRIPAVLTALALGTVAATATTTAVAAPTAGGGSDARERAFAAAATEFGVPEPLLEAVSYAQTRWEGHAGQHNTGGGYGPMNLVDGSLFTASPAQQRDGAGPSTVVPASVDSLGSAARLLGVDRDVLRRDTAANIRGGAALLASKQAALNLPTGPWSDVGQWYASVAAASGAADTDGAADFADAAYQVLTTGAARTTTDGQAVSLAAQPASPQRAQLDRLGLASPKSDPNVECPTSIRCESIPAPYVQYGPTPGAYGNHDLAARDTSAGPAVQYIVVHDTEASWQTTLDLVQDPTYVSWHYSIRSADGLVAQHVPTKDVAWHAGNWYVNMHSIGIEHEGFAPDGATWYSEPMYRNSAKLVRYLADKYDIPLDRGHILGHDQVPGITPAGVAGMHWDPGPFWDWEHYFQLMGAPLQAKAVETSDVVRILPGFNDNQQPVTGCETPGVACEPQGTNFVYLHTAPSESAPLVTDIGLRPGGTPSTTDVADIGARATAGVEYAVAGRAGDWTAIWWLGQQAWFHNPAAAPTAIPVTGSVVVPKAGRTSVPVYGRAYPEAAAYAAYPGVPVQSVVPLQYAILAGQRYALQDATIVTDYYRATTFAGTPPSDHVDIRGQDAYYQVSLGHRTAYVRAADVDIVPAG